MNGGAHPTPTQVKASTGHRVLTPAVVDKIIDQTVPTVEAVGMLGRIKKVFSRKRKKV